MIHSSPFSGSGLTSADGAAGRRAVRKWSIFGAIVLGYSALLAVAYESILHLAPAFAARLFAGTNDAFLLAISIYVVGWIGVISLAQFEHCFDD